MQPEPNAEAAPIGAGGRLSVVLLSGDFARVHYGLVLATAALAIGRPVTLFFTLEATRALVRGEGGWTRLTATDGRSGAEVDAAYRACGVVGFEELLAAAVELGARIIVCEMGLRALGQTAADLRGDLPVEIAGAVTLLAEAAAAPIVL